MVYRVINSKYFVASIHDVFRVDNHDWEARIPNWVGRALEHMNIYVGMKPIPQTKQVVNYQVKLPCDIKVLERIEYKGRPLRRMGVINHRSPSTVSTLYDSTSPNSVYNADEGYELTNQGWATFTFETGEVTIFYKAIPVEQDQVTGAYYPLVPDVEKVKEAIEWYILMRMCMAGYKHPTYSLDSKNPITNPAVQWDVTKRAAANAANTMDSDERHELSCLLRDFIVNNEAHFNEFFDNSKETI